MSRDTHQTLAKSFHVHLEQICTPNSPFHSCVCLFVFLLNSAIYLLLVPFLTVTPAFLLNSFCGSLCSFFVMPYPFVVFCLRFQSKDICTQLQDGLLKVTTELQTVSVKSTTRNTFLSLNKQRKAWLHVSVCRHGGHTTSTTQSMFVPRGS